MREIEPRALAAWLRGEPEGRDARQARAPLVLDVREDWERRICHLPQSVHIPMREIVPRLREIDPDRPVVCLCHHGMRSAQVAMFLEQNGVGEVYNLAGGIHAWACEVDPSCATY